MLSTHQSRHLILFEENMLLVLTGSVLESGSNHKAADNILFVKKKNP